ncbi:MAG: tRNA (adenosine(37)-N6)-threonylcarbamoyltransferase complex transferase subunit TsaD, partial [Caldimicrobium sp.]
MLLAIETSCDETGVALFSEEGKLIKDVLYSQVALHSPFGGVVP